MMTQPWTPTDDRKLLLLAAKNHTQPVIARYLGRTVSAVRSRLVVLRENGVIAFKTSPSQQAAETRDVQALISKADRWCENCGGCGYTIVGDSRVACACTTTPHRRHIPAHLASARRGERMEFT